MNNKEYMALRCGNKHCRHKINRSQAMRWFAQLVTDGIVPRAEVGYSEPAALPQVSTQQEATQPFVQGRFELPSRNQLTRLDGQPVFYRTNWIKGDGNCMFAAIVKALGIPRLTHLGARRAAVAYARKFQDDFFPFLESQSESMGAYLRRMGKAGTWGDDLMLKALSGAYNVKIRVYKRHNDGSHQWYEIGEGEDSIGLYLASEHYENLVTADELFGR